MGTIAARNGLANQNSDNDQASYNCENEESLRFYAPLFPHPWTPATLLASEQKRFFIKKP